jgi:hypothetical protein
MLDPLMGDGYGDGRPVDVLDAALDGLNVEQRRALAHIRPSLSWCRLRGSICAVVPNSPFEVCPMNGTGWVLRIVVFVMALSIWRSCSVANEALELAAAAEDRADAVQRELDAVRSDVETLWLQSPGR